MTDSLREMKNQWALKDWERDVASYYRYKEAAEKLEANRLASANAFAVYCRGRMAEIAARYPNVKW